MDLLFKNNSLGYTGESDFPSPDPEINSTKLTYSDLEKANIECMYRSYMSVQREKDVVYCEPVFDGVACWTAVPANNTVHMPCPIDNAPDDIFASRFCTLGGKWENKSDYTDCIKYINDLTPKPETEETDRHLAIVLRDIYFVCSIVSLFCLIVTLFIFIYFRSLQCNRISIHKNLVVSFIVRFVVLIVIIEPFVTGRESSYRDVEWLCKIMLALTQYTILANIYWMLVEGLFLHNSIVVSVFSTEAPFKLFFLIGWGFPALIVIAWAIVMHFTNFEKCWNNYSQSPFAYIILVPFLAALITNLIFLINIIRILVTKLRANNTMESDRIKKAIKATIVLMPLLGITNILFLWNPEDGSSLQTAYHVINAVLQSTQGIMVSIFYCFMNGEVRRVIRRKWDRFKIRRFLSSSRRRRSSRTSSFVLSQTETTQAQNSSVNCNNHFHYQTTNNGEQDVNKNHVTSDNPWLSNQADAYNIPPISRPDCTSHLLPSKQNVNNDDDDDNDVWVKNRNFDEIRETALLGDDDVDDNSDVVNGNEEDGEAEVFDSPTQNTAGGRSTPSPTADLMNNIASSGNFDWLGQFIINEGNENSNKELGPTTVENVPEDDTEKEVYNDIVDETPHLPDDQNVSSLEENPPETRSPTFKSPNGNYSNLQSDSSQLFHGNSNLVDRDEWAEILQICESFQKFDDENT